MMYKRNLLKVLFVMFVLASVFFVLEMASADPDPTPGTCPDGKPGCIASDGSEDTDLTSSTPVPGPCPDGKPGC